MNCSKDTHYLERLQKTYDYLNRKYEQELADLRRKIYLERFYQENKDKLLDIIHKDLGITEYDSSAYSNVLIRGGNYRNMSEHCKYKNANYVVHFSYYYGENKYFLYLYDNHPPLVYVNNKETSLDETANEFLPINHLLRLLKGDAQNYQKLHSSNPIYRWGSPEEHGLA